MPDSCCRNVPTLTSKSRVPSSLVARFLNSSGVRDSRPACPAGRFIGTPRRSSVLHTPSKLGWPQDVRGAFQDLSTKAAAVVSAGTDRCDGGGAVGALVCAAAYAATQKPIVAVSAAWNLVVAMLSPHERQPHAIRRAAPRKAVP